METTTSKYKEVFQLAKDKGYKGTFVVSYKDNQVTHPEAQKYIFLELTLIQKWLREEHKIDVTPSVYHSTTSERKYFSNCYYVKKGKEVYDSSEWINKCEKKAATLPYEQALLTGIHEALKLIAK